MLSFVRSGINQYAHEKKGYYTAVTPYRSPFFFICIPTTCLALGVYALRIGIDLQPFLRHGSITEEVQGHPHQVALDLVELLPYLLRRHERIVEMALLELVMPGEESFVVVEGFDCRSH